MGYKVEKGINEIKRTSMQKTTALNFIRVPYLMPVLFIARFLVKEGTEIESNLKINKFQMLLVIL